MKRLLLKYAFLFVGLLFFGQILKAQQVIISDSVSLKLAESGIIHINANLVNNSDTTIFDGTVNFVGDTTYEISGTAPLIFDTLSLSSTAGVSLLTDVSVISGLILNSGTLNLVNNNLTIGNAAAISGLFSPIT